MTLISKFAGWIPQKEDVYKIEDLEKYNEERDSKKLSNPTLGQDGNNLRNKPLFIHSYCLYCMVGIDQKEKRFTGISLS